MRILPAAALCLLLPAAIASATESATPSTAQLALANVYQPHAGKPIDLQQYWVSEKYDGVRAYWDGQRLRSRNGKPFAAPDWFIASLPAAPLDGELWAGRGKFEQTVSIVRRQSAHPQWRDIRYMVFDLPEHGGAFAERYAALSALAENRDDPCCWAPVEQQPIASAQWLRQHFESVVAAGGEGLMLRRWASRHHAGRSDDLLKYKPFDDAEATIIGYRPGRGKYTGMVGSLQVRTADGRIFNVGSGLSDAQRAQPPPLGAVITYRHQGLTDKGLPRFPVFLRLRELD